MSDTAHSKFMAAGLRLYPQFGYQKLSVRALAAEAGLSAGMFHHLFASKEAFVAEMLWQYAAMAGLSTSVQLPDEPFQRLRETIRITAFFIRDHLAVAHRVLADSADGVAVVNEFMKSVLAQRMALVGELLQACARLDNSRPADTAQQLAYLNSAVTAPMIVGTRFQKMGLLPSPLDQRVDHVLSDEAILQRIDWSIEVMFPRYRSALGHH